MSLKSGTKQDLAIKAVLNYVDGYQHIYEEEKIYLFERFVWLKKKIFFP